MPLIIVLCILLNENIQKGYKMPKWKKTKVDLLLDVLNDFSWHSTDELANKVGRRFGDAVYKARNIGYRIETDRQQNRYRYRLLPN